MAYNFLKRTTPASSRPAAGKRSASPRSMLIAIYDTLRSRIETLETEGGRISRWGRRPETLQGEISRRPRSSSGPMTSKTGRGHPLRPTPRTPTRPAVKPRLTTTSALTWSLHPSSTLPMAPSLTATERPRRSLLPPRLRAEAASERRARHISATISPASVEGSHGLLRANTPARGQDAVGRAARAKPPALTEFREPSRACSSSPTTRSPCRDRWHPSDSDPAFP